MTAILRSLVAALVIFALLPSWAFMRLKTFEAREWEIISTRTVLFPMPADWNFEIIAPDGDIVCSWSGVSFYDWQGNVPLRRKIPRAECPLQVGTVYVLRGVWTTPAGFLGLFPIRRETIVQISSAEPTNTASRSD